MHWFEIKHIVVFAVINLMAVLTTLMLLEVTGNQGVRIFRTALQCAFVVAIHFMNFWQSQLLVDVN